MSTPTIPHSASSSVPRSSPDSPVLVALVSLLLAGAASPADASEASPAGEPWVADISFSRGLPGEHRNLTLGSEPGATSALDEHLGEFELPPPPPGGALEVWFELPGGERSYRDFRSPEEEAPTWTIRIDRGGGSDPLTVTWENVLLPPGTVLAGSSDSGGPGIRIAMRDTHEALIEDPTITTLRVEAGEAGPPVVEARAGWNLVSAPRLAPDMGVDAMLPGRSSDVLAYADATYRAVTTVENGVGYWVRFDEDVRIPSEGATPSVEVEIAAGWNLVGPFDRDVRVDQLVTTPPGLLDPVVYGYDHGYHVAGRLRVGHGYWVRSRGDGTLRLSEDGSGAAGRGASTALAPLLSVEVRVEDGRGGVQSLLAGVHSIGSEGLEASLDERDLPPPPAPGAFDARWALPGGAASHVDVRGVAPGSPAVHDHLLVCRGEETSEAVLITWELPPGVSMRLLDPSSGAELASQDAAGEGAWTLPAVAGVWVLRLTYDPDGGDLYRRGQLNGDDRADISDAVFALRHLFQGGAAPSCPAALDINADGFRDISDPVYLLNHLFLGGLPPAEPYETPAVCPRTE